MTKKKAAAPASGTAVLRTTRKEDRTDERMFADEAADGVAGNAVMLATFTKRLLGEIDLTSAVQALDANAETVSRGDLRGVEAMLCAQAAALNAMFCELARRSGANMGEYMGAAETYMRLALKAQGQCRATLETLAAIKNPPVFARQANINHGQQQVNNGPAPGAPAHTPAAPAAQPATQALQDATGAQAVDALALPTYSPARTRKIPVPAERTTGGDDGERLDT